jgi:flagellar hook assembly protein FlgD
MLTIEAYNSAGEKVKLITHVQVSGNINNVLLLFKGNQADTFDPGVAGLTIRMPGIAAPGQLNGEVDETWDGTAGNGNTVGQGIYYIKISVTDSFGHVNTVIEEVGVLKVEQWVRLSIYNTAGELVARMQKNKVPAAPVDLDIPEVLYIGQGASNIDLKYSTDGSMFEWDGRNSQGKLVDTGIYEIVVEEKTIDGYYNLVTTRSVTIMKVNGQGVLGDVKAYPNPFVVEEDGFTPATIDWSNKTAGNVTVRIYNVAGELVRTLSAGLDAPAGIKWDLTTGTGRYVSTGLYEILIQGKNAAGEEQRKSIKFVVIQKYGFENDRVN